MRLLPLFFILLLLPGCGSRQAGESDGMDATVALRAVHRCSRISPEIDVVNYPAATDRFEVRLEDRSDSRKFHGGGSWKNDGTGVIPEGALMQHYMGPCPPADAERSYQYVITAVDAEGNPLMARHIIFVQD